MTDAPQRHSANRGPFALVSILLPLTSTSSTSPSTRYGPLGLMLIFDEELVLACLLHDVGRYALAQDEVSDTLEIAASRSAAARGHHEAGADLIAPHVPARVAFLIRAHTDAKRYLCATEPGYHDRLSRGSKHTLTLQGGVMTAEEIERAETNPWWPDALRLRRWDDEAKVVGKKTRPLSAWKPLIQKYFDAGAPGS